MGWTLTQTRKQIQREQTQGQETGLALRPGQRHATFLQTEHKNPDLRQMAKLRGDWNRLNKKGNKPGSVTR